MRIMEGVHRLCDYDDSSSEYALLIGWHVRLIKVLVCDWLKHRRNIGRWLGDINYCFGPGRSQDFCIFILIPLRKLILITKDELCRKFKFRKIGSYFRVEIIWIIKSFVVSAPTCLVNYESRVSELLSKNRITKSTVAACASCADLICSARK